MDKLTKVEIITRPSKFDELKEALNDIGVTGMTVSQVMGCGTQKGSKEMYRGVPLDITLLPKIRIETVVCEVPVENVIAAAKEVLHTGEIGDGKIFIYEIKNAIKIRTGEEGVKAL